MPKATRQTRSELMGMFSELGWHPRHDLGQNFLIDLNLMDFIVAQAELDERDVVLEIGSGTGGLTTFLAQQAGHVVSVEIDPKVHGLARAATSEIGNVTLLLTDALQSKHRFAPAVLEALETHLSAGPERRLKLVANLPYAIATPVISNLVASELPWQTMIVTVQWELAERMRAAPATDDYGALSVWLQSQCRVKVLRKLGPQVFWPRPQVDSAIVGINRDVALAGQAGDRNFFHEFIRSVFAQRRKALRGVLAGAFRSRLDKAAIDAVLAGCNVAGTIRAEQLPVQVLVELSNALQRALSETN